MGGLSLYLDECTDHGIIAYLITRGHTVTTAQAQGTHNDPDDAQIRYATEQGWIIVTTNRRHFYRRRHEFRQRGEPHSGIITVPQDDRDQHRFSVRCAMMASWVATAFSTPENILFRWSDLQTMLHQGYQPEGFTPTEITLALGIHAPPQKP